MGSILGLGSTLPQLEEGKGVFQYVLWVWGSRRDRTGGSSPSRVHDSWWLVPDCLEGRTEISWRCEEGRSLAAQWKWLECEGKVGVNPAQAFMWPQEAGVANPVRLECRSVAGLGPT